MRETLYGKLISYRDSDYYGFHMPGHKRNPGLTGAELPYGIDITEIEGFDDLHHAGGVLQQAQERAAKLYRAEETCYLVNGSTSGILSAIMGCTQKGDKILMARNCHKSAYHAAFLNELRVEYVYPQYLDGCGLNGEIHVGDIKRILQEDRQSLGGGGRIRAVVIVSPTYDGVVSDVRAISGAVHEYGIPLIVDQAHGAHFGFHPYFPQNANVLGADVVIHSLHKTLPSLTQTALLHINGEIVDRGEIRQYLRIFQSSSPSYVLMAGIDECVNLLETKGRGLFERYVEILAWTRSELKKMQGLRLVDLSDGQSAETQQDVPFLFDFSKLVVSTKDTGKSGKWLYRILWESYHLQMEMAAGSYVLAMTSVGDTKEGMERLVKALLEIDGQLWQNRSAGEIDEVFSAFGGDFKLPRPEQVYTSAEAEKMKRDKRGASLLWKEGEGRISAEYAYLYPPGIPLLVPGERISREVLDTLEMYRSLDFEIQGLSQEGRIMVL